MNKNDLWKALREPATKTCLNCKFYHVITSDLKESLKCVSCSTRELPDSPKVYWKWDGTK